VEECTKIAMAWLQMADDNLSISLRMYPGDTLTQSRALYHANSSVEAVLALRADGWHVRPNFHWGFTAAGYAWSTTSLPVEQYCTYWIRHIPSTREVQRGEWEDYWQELLRAGIVEVTDREMFDTHFTTTARSKASPRPGLFCEYSWPLTEAQRLDANGRLAPQIRKRIDQMLAALGEPRLPSESTDNE
jgi:hypothetical protein